MFFDAPPPETSGYMIAGYAIFFLIMVIYLASLFVRSRNLNQDLSTLENVEAEKEAEPRVAAPVTRAAKAKTKASANRPQGSKAKRAQKKTARKK